LRTLSEAGYDTEDTLSAEGNWSSRSGKRAFLALIEKHPEIDGVFVANDQMALGVLQTASQLGIDIPNKLKVVGFDGIPESEFFSPPLSTVHQDLEELGCLAVKELVHIIENKNSSNQDRRDQYIKIQPKLIVRQTT
jgi:DNA-binding LacI/PurR family transcriptional regulator